MVEKRKLRIKEAFDNSVPAWLRPVLHDVAKPVHTRYGSHRKPAPITGNLDLSTAKFVHAETPVNARDPKWSDEIIIPVFHGEDMWGREFTWIMGYNDPYVSVDPDDGWKRKNISKVAKSKVINMCNTFGYFIKGDGADDVAAKRQSRKDSRDGALDRDLTKAQRKSDYDGSWYTAQGYDKSGYAKNPGKYQHMLAQLNLGRYEEILDKGAEASTECSQILPIIRRTYKTSREKNTVYDIVGNLNRQLTATFSELDRYYSEWQEQMTDDPEWGSDSYLKGHVLECIKSLRNYTRKALNFVEAVKSGVDIEELWRKFYR